jgi:hypothetical protein
MTRRRKAAWIVAAVLALAAAFVVVDEQVPRRDVAMALISEGDNTLQEMKVLAWAYYDQYGGWTGVDDANWRAAFGFGTQPAGACWTYHVTAADATSITVEAQSVGAVPAKCAALGADGAFIIDLVIGSDGSSARTQSMP